MTTRKATLIVNRNGRCVDNRLWKSPTKAKAHIKAIIKNNSIKQRKMVGYIGLKIKEARHLYPREVDELKKAKNFIWK